MKKVGLVLEGGAMRGLFTAGVLDVFSEDGILFDLAAGVSAGAVFGCNFKSRQVGRVLRYNTRYCKDRRYCSLFSLVTTGSLFGTEFCYHTLPEELDPFDWKAWEENPMPFYAVCTSLSSGEARCFLCQGERKEIMEVFRASASMPLVSRAVRIGSEEYLDGGISASIPLMFSEEKGCEKNVVILTRPRDYEKKASKGKVLFRLLYGKYPAFCRAMEHRHEAYKKEKETVFSREGEKKAFVIAPPLPLPCARVEKDPEKLRKTYEMGREAARESLAALKEFLLS